MCQVCKYFFPQAELDVSINSSSSNYNRDKGRDLASSSQLVDFESGIMDKITFKSQPSSVDSKRFAVGLLKDGKRLLSCSKLCRCKCSCCVPYFKGALHLTPVTGYLQMKPTFRHMDKGKSAEERGMTLCRAHSYMLLLIPCECCRL